MKTKSRIILSTIVAFVLLLAAIAAGLNAIFTITLVDTEFVVCSEAGREEAVELKSKLDRFVGKSTTFIDLDDMKNIVDDYPCFRVERIAKKFPETVEIKLVERKELYAFRNGESYAILDEEGTFLYVGENVNRMGGMNILLKNFQFSVASDGTVSGRLFEEVLATFSIFSDLLPGIRANVVALRLTHDVRAPSGPENEYFVITMREGVEIAIRKPSEGIAQKALTAFSEQAAGYLNLSDEQRVSGAITVGDLIGDVVNVTYSPVLPIEEEI